MALVIDFDTKLKDGCKTFHFIDKVNWGAPEIEANDASITDAFITFESKAGVETVLNVFASGFPNDTDLELDITSLIGGSGQDESRKKLIFIDCTSAECVAKKLASIEVADCDCDPTKVDNAILANTLLKAARQAACCNQTERWEELIAMVNRLCKTC
jgi:hypothetical protein